MGSKLARGGILAFSALAVAWLALSFRAVGLQEDGQALIERAQTGQVSPAEVTEGLAALDSAGRFNADKTPVVTEASLLATVGRRQAAEAVLRSLTEKEPANVQAWFLAVALARDPSGRERAQREVERLNPWAD